MADPPPAPEGKKVVTSRLPAKRNNEAKSKGPLTGRERVILMEELAAKAQARQDRSLGGTIISDDDDDEDDDGNAGESKEEALQRLEKQKQEIQLKLMDLDSLELTSTVHKDKISERRRDLDGDMRWVERSIKHFEEREGSPFDDEETPAATTRDTDGATDKNDDEETPAATTRDTNGSTNKNDDIQILGVSKVTFDEAVKKHDGSRNPQKKIRDPRWPKGTRNYKVVRHLVVGPGERWPKKNEEAIDADESAEDAPNDDERWSKEMRKVLMYLGKENDNVAVGIRRAYQHQHLVKDASRKSRYMPDGVSIDTAGFLRRPVTHIEMTMVDHFSGSADKRVRLCHLSGVQCQLMAMFEYQLQAPMYFVDEGIWIKDVVSITEIDFVATVKPVDHVKTLRLAPGQKVDVPENLYDMSVKQREALTLQEVLYIQKTIRSLVRHGLPLEVRRNIQHILQFCDFRETMSSTVAWRAWKKRWDGDDPVPMTFCEYEVMRCSNMGDEHPAVKKCINQFNLQFYRQSSMVFDGMNPVNFGVDGHGQAQQNNEIATPRKTKLQRELEAAGLRKRTGEGPAGNVGDDKSGKKNSDKGAQLTCGAVDILPDVEKYIMESTVDISKQIGEVEEKVDGIKPNLERYVKASATDLGGQFEKGMGTISREIRNGLKSDFEQCIKASTTDLGERFEKRMGTVSGEIRESMPDIDKPVKEMGESLHDSLLNLGRQMGEMNKESNKSVVALSNMMKESNENGTKMIVDQIESNGKGWTKSMSEMESRMETSTNEIKGLREYLEKLDEDKQKAADERCREQYQIRIRELSDQLTTVKAERDRAVNQLKDDRDLLKTAIEERDDARKTLREERRQSTQFYRIEKRYVKYATRTASTAIAALAIWKGSPVLARIGAKWSGPRLQRLGRWLSDRALDAGQQDGE